MGNASAPHGPMTSVLTVHADQWTRPFWDAGSRGELVCATCADCGTARMPPGPLCAKCRSSAIDWVTLPGTGSVYTYTVVRHAALPELEAVVPYCVAVVTLDEADGCRLIVPLAAGSEREARIGWRVRIRWETANGNAFPFAEVLEGAE